ncbi:hypothetical protein DXG01_014313 [Tephrocybe rancida]|nr:hypothetical protein DXG01_014313 [Tephrocybe rancida]
MITFLDDAIVASTEGGVLAPAPPKLAVDGASPAVPTNRHLRSRSTASSGRAGSPIVFVAGRACGEGFTDSEGIVAGAVWPVVLKKSQRKSNLFSTLLAKHSIGGMLCSNADIDAMLDIALGS